ncbi:hypothetical protein ACH41C_06715 [Streptomyces althioticus]|uniref:hypothetical protein n=1 Tax=Streptomyces althioticus TaxID=83380 RepID=UPI0033DDE34E
MDSAAAGSNHLSHPGGVHMALNVGMGRDGILLHRARGDGGKLTGWDVNECLDRILTEVHAGHPGFLAVEHYGADLRLHALDGTVLAEQEQSEPAEGEEEACWDYGCGFVDADTVIASTADSDRYPERARHWLLGAHTLPLPGPCRRDRH